DQHRLDAIEQIHFTNTYTRSISMIVVNVPPAHDRARFDLRSIQLNQAPGRVKLIGSVLTISLPSDLAPNASVDLTIDFTVYIPALADTQSFASSNLAYTDEATNIGYWYPILAPFRSGKWISVPWYPIGDPFASDIADYTATITATPGVTVVAGGLMSHQDNVWHYAIDRARTFGMLASSHYVETHYTFSGVTYSVYTFDRHTILAWPALYTLVRAAQLYGQLYGTYPYSTLRAAEVSGPWSMEFSGLVAIGSTDYAGYDDTTHNRLFRIIAHEVSHQWWYNIVGDNQVQEPWLDEGFARFNELRFYETYSPQDAQWWWSTIIDPWTAEGPIDQPISSFDSQRVYLTDVYNQGAQFLDALRTRLGRSNFNLFMRDLFQREAFGLMTTNDFFSVVREHTKVNLASLLRKYFSRKYWYK
ncbi:MAG TPA: M1 family metallopeptidase, partial [Anaerolineae bacterium]|nr:M1 family metallopeptidase [Anaerolineae bacterium]